ncbi:helix-turn-helix domain-containing protein [Streptacidiphilus rugosus]|uniref:helix-turn-helix domain-containing protein n=1 Tax=Streptacidiphilus rugosus TaxID=405783 RepID=UPI00056316B0|nr:helix-turn-helix transcriptional regulator [Streptacidiphilus rugosus]
MTSQLNEDLREARRSSGLPWARFAREAGYAPSHLLNVENGSRRLTPEIAAAYDRVLGTAFAAALQDAGTAAAGSTPWDTAGNLRVFAELADGSSVDRRGFLTAGIALSASAATWAASLRQHAAPDEPAPERGDPELLDQVDKRLDDLRHLDDEVGSGEVHRLARNELLYLVVQIKSGRYRGKAVDRLHSLAAEAARQAAWSAFDQGRHALAQRFFDGSLRASAQAGDPISGAIALSFAAVQCYSTPGQAGRAVSLLEAAGTEVRDKATPLMHAMLAARRARALSKTGTGARKDCARQLALARTALGKGSRDDDPRSLYWVTEGEFEMIAGSCALQLGDPAEAVHRFEAAIKASYPGDEAYPRSHAIYLARAAEAHLEMHDLDAAVANARHAALCLGSVDSARSSSELKGLRGKLAAHTSNPAVRDFLQVG